MYQLNYIKGNLFTTQRDIVAHSVNCQGAFGAGIAGQIARLYPLARQAYLNKFKHDGWHLGEIQLVPIDTNDRKIIVANMAMQDTYGKKGVHVSYKACYEAFSKLFRYASMHKDSVALPKVGVGLGGGQWLEVEKMLIKALEPYTLEVDVYYL